MSSGFAETCIHHNIGSYGTNTYMVTSLIGVLVVTFVFILAILVFIPAWLKRLARRNVRGRRELVKTMRMLDPAMASTENSLMRFSQTQSQRYRRRRNHALAELKTAQAARRGAGRKLQDLEFITVPDEGRPISFFLTYPEYLVSIPSATFGLWRAQRMLGEAQGHLEAAQVSVEALLAMPDNIKQLHSKLEQQLQTLENALAAERQAGIQALADLETRLQILKNEFSNLQTQTNGAPGEPAQNDLLALELERFEAQLKLMHEDVRTLNESRLACDEKLQAAQQAFKQMPLQQHKPAVPAELRPIFDSARGWLRTAVSCRQQRDFIKATAMVDLGQQLIGLTNDLYQVHQGLQTLRAEQSHSLHSEAILGLDQQYRQILTELTEQLQQAGIDSVQIPPLVNALARYQTQIKQIYGQATHTQKNLDADRQNSQKAAAKANKRLSQSWQNLQKVVRLEPEDAWRQAYTSLQNQYESAQNETVTLQRYTSDAAALAQQIEDLREALVDEYRLLRDYLRDVPALQSQAQNMAGKWACLQNLAGRLNVLAGEIKEKGELALHANTINVVDAALEDVSQLQEQMQHGLNQLQVESERLEQSVDNISYATQLVLDGSGAVRPDLQSSLDLIQRYYQQALGTEECTEAIRVMAKAEDLANQMALH